MWSSSWEYWLHNAAGKYILSCKLVHIILLQNVSICCIVFKIKFYIFSNIKKQFWIILFVGITFTPVTLIIFYLNLKQVAWLMLHIEHKVLGKVHHEIPCAVPRDYLCLPLTHSRGSSESLATVKCLDSKRNISLQKFKQNSSVNNKEESEPQS